VIPGDGDRWHGDQRNQDMTNWAERLRRNRDNSNDGDRDRHMGDERWRNHDNNGGDRDHRFGDDRWRNHDRDNNWNHDRNRDWDHDRWRDHHPRWWRPDFFHYGRYWYPQYYNNGWNDTWRYGIGLRFFDDLYWWNYENEWWFWDANGACWRQGDPRWDGGYGGYGGRYSYWPREWNEYRWRFCYDGGDDNYGDY